MPFANLLYLIGGKQAVITACKLRELLFQNQVSYDEFRKKAGLVSIEQLVLSNIEFSYVSLVLRYCNKTDQLSRYRTYHPFTRVERNKIYHIGTIQIVSHSI